MTTPGPEVKPTMEDIAQYDAQIATLMECKPLPETDVKKLCEKVCICILKTAHFDNLINPTDLFTGQGDSC